MISRFRQVTSSASTALIWNLHSVQRCEWRAKARLCVIYGSGAVVKLLWAPGRNDGGTGVAVVPLFFAGFPLLSILHSCIISRRSIMKRPLDNL